MLRQIINKWFCSHSWESHRVEHFEEFKSSGDSMPCSNKVVEVFICTKCGEFHTEIYRS